MKHNTSNSSFLAGLAALIGGVCLFSTVEVASKIIGARVHPVVLTFIRFSLTGIVLLTLSLPNLRTMMGRFTFRDYGIFLLNGAVGITCAISIFHAAVLALDKAASAAVVFSVNPVFVVLLARFINDEQWTLRTWVAAVLGAWGVFFFSLETGAFTFQSMVGLGLMVVAAFLFALSVCITRKFVVRYGVMVFMGYSAVLGSALLVPLMMPHLTADMMATLADAWAPVLYLTIAGTVLAYTLYYYGILKTSAQMGGLIFFLKPAVASCLAVIILGEAVNMYMLIGMAMIIAGVGVAVNRA